MTPLELYRTLVPISTPLLTFYGDGERIDLSGPVLARWLAKTSNYLLQEDVTGSESTVAIDLPCHWRSVVWAAGCWMAGCKISSWNVDDSTPEILVSNDIAHLESADAEILLAQTMPSLSLQWKGALSPGTACALSELMAQPDDLIPIPGIKLSAPVVNGLEISLPTFDAQADRLLLATRSWEEAFGFCLSAWRSGSSVVMVTDEREDLDKIKKIESVNVIFNSLG